MQAKALRQLVLCLLMAGVTSSSWGCATIPDGQYGVDEIQWAGVEEMSEEAVEVCLATRERDSVKLRLGFSEPSCGNPPFDDTPPSTALWSFPWSEWPVYDPAIVAVDRDRIGRWYEARGYYDTQVTEVLTWAGGEPVESPDCPEGGDCELRLIFQVEEGEPVIVEDIRIVMTRPIPPELEVGLHGLLRLEVGARFDEAFYEGDKDRLEQALGNAAYARAEADGKVLIDRRRRIAKVEYRLDPGDTYVFGETRVKTADEIPADIVARAAAILPGEPYNEDTLDDAQRAVFALGVFSSVKFERQFREGSDAVDILIDARPGRMVTPSAGVGITSGTLQRVTSDEVTSVPQWDVHLSVAYEHRNFLGGLRRLRIEERPRLIMLDDFPKTGMGGPRLGNVVSLIFEQPDTFEPRTILFSENEWDYGPDAFYGYFRHDVADKLGLRRAFFKQRLVAHVAVQHDLYEITDEAAAPDTVSDYRLPFLEQQVRLDLRDDARRPIKGMYVSVTAQEALQLGGYGSWNYLRVIPDLRGYVPLLWHVVLAARFALGALFIFDADSQLDDTSAVLGPQTYRLRGGGAYSNRGFFAGELGAGEEGGIRRWEGSLELRVPLGADLGIVAFGDVGDVSQGTSFRWSHLNTAAGVGLRYYSIVGAIRLDLAWRIAGLQRASGSAPVDAGAAPSAWHLTIGEAF